MWSAIGVGVLAMIAVAGLGVAAVQARTTAQDGYSACSTGSNSCSTARSPRRATHSQQASDDLADAGDDLGGLLTQIARLHPGHRPEPQRRHAMYSPTQPPPRICGRHPAVRRPRPTHRVRRRHRPRRPRRISRSPLDDLEVDRQRPPRHARRRRVAVARRTVPESARHGHPPRRPGRPPSRGDRGDRPHRAGDARRRRDRAATSSPSSTTPRPAGTSGLMGNWCEITVDNGATRGHRQAAEPPSSRSMRWTRWISTRLTSTCSATPATALCTATE